MEANLVPACVLRVSSRHAIPAGETAPSTGTPSRAVRGSPTQAVAPSRTTAATARKAASVPNAAASDGTTRLPARPPSDMASDLADTAVARTAAGTRSCRTALSNGQVAPCAT